MVFDTAVTRFQLPDAPFPLQGGGDPPFLAHSRGSQVLLQKWPEPMDAHAQMPGERGSSTSRRRTDLRSVCGRLTIDRRRRKVRIPLLNRALHTLAHTMFTY